MTTTNSGRIETTAANYSALTTELGFAQYAVVLTERGWVAWGYCGAKHTMVVVVG